MKNDICLRHQVWFLSFFFFLLPFPYEDLKYYSFYYGNAKTPFLESQKRESSLCARDNDSAIDPEDALLDYFEADECNLIPIYFPFLCQSKIQSFLHEISTFSFQPQRGITLCSFLGLVGENFSSRTLI